MASSVFADVAVIVNPKNNAVVSEVQLRSIYLGKVKTFDNGISVKPLDLALGNDARKVFFANFLHKSEANMNSYWARMLFSSKGRPPEEVANSATAVKLVASSVEAIAYVDSADVTSAVRVLFTLK